MRFFDLKHKEVINVQSCRSLGCVSDLDIDCKTGCILALIVPRPRTSVLVPGTGI